MKWRTLAPLAAILLLLTLIGLVFHRLRAPHPRYSSPTAIRTNDNYLHAHAPSREFPPFAESVPIHLSRTDNSLTIASPRTEVPPLETTYGPLTTHRASATNAIEIDHGSIRLALIGMATEARPTPPAQHNVRVEPKFFGPDLKALDIDDLRRELGYPNPRDPMMFDPAHDLVVPSIPGAEFFFACSNIVGFKPIWFRAFDARTHYDLLNTRFNVNQKSNRFSFAAGLNLWHQTPVELITVVGTGPAASYPLAPQPEAEVRFSGTLLRILAIVKGELEQTSYAPGSNSVGFTIRSGNPPSFKSASIVVYCWPPAYLLPIDLEAYDLSDKLLSAGPFFPVSHDVSVMQVYAPPERIKQIRVKHYPNLHRLIFTLPELPGLPEENRNLQNLLDVRIPYLKLNQPRAREQALGTFAQMQVAYLPYKRSDWNMGSLVTLTNITTGRLLQQLEDEVQSPYVPLTVDPEASEIRPRRNPLLRVLRFLGLGG